MKRFLQKLFSRRDRLTKLAHGDDRDAFITELGKADIFVFSALKGEGIDPLELDADNLLALTEETVQDLSESEAFYLFKYETQERVRLPFFSSERHAQTFAGNYCKACNRVYGFEMLGISGHVLVTQIGDWDLGLNDWTDDQYTLTPDDIELLRRHARNRGLLGV